MNKGRSRSIVKVDHSDEAREALLSEEPSDEEADELMELGSNASAGASWGSRRRNPCYWKAWSGWGHCPVSCGSSNKKRSRGMEARRRGPSCWTVQTQISSCSHWRYCPVHCKFSAWSSWSPGNCPVACGTGKQTSTRHFAPGAAHGGIQCDDPTLNYLERPCNEHHCPINCNFNPWLSWTDCDKSCGGGNFQRVRVRRDTKEHAGAQCNGDYLQWAKCNTHPCPVDCVVQPWTDWGNCTEDCDGGERTRLKEIITPQLYGGKECPPTEENGTCNEEACEKAASIGGALPEISVFVAVLLATISLQERYAAQDC
jgi:hypothetical protein